MPKRRAKHVDSKESSEFKWDDANDAILLRIVEQVTVSEVRSAPWTLIAQTIREEIGNETVPVGKQCRERWTEQVDPSLSRAPFTDDDVIFMLRRYNAGHKYAVITEALKTATGLNRPQNRVKNKIQGALKQPNFKEHRRLAAASPISIEADQTIGAGVKRSRSDSSDSDTERKPAKKRSRHLENSHAFFQPVAEHSILDASTIALLEHDPYEGPLVLLDHDLLKLT